MQACYPATCVRGATRAASVPVPRLQCCQILWHRGTYLAVAPPAIRNRATSKHLRHVAVAGTVEIAQQPSSHQDHLGKVGRSVQSMQVPEPPFGPNSPCCACSYREYQVLWCAPCGDAGPGPQQVKGILLRHLRQVGSETPAISV